MRAAPDPLLVERIETLEALLGLERQWRQIEPASNVPFTRWDWAVAWWTQLRESKLGVKDSLFVRAIRTSSGRLVAVAPMLISRRPSVGPLCVRQLQFFGADPNITNHLYRGAVGAIGRSTTLQKAVQFLARRSPVTVNP